jgi:hypothetical protein
MMLPDGTLAIDLWFLFKVGVILFAGLYFIFSLIVMRQIRLMTDTLITNVSPVIRAFGILHALFSLGVVILLIFFA